MLNLCMNDEIIIAECNSNHEWIGDPLYCSACGVDKGNEITDNA
jgi:hypothetical protein